MHRIHHIQTKKKTKSIVFQARYRTTTRQQVKYDTKQCLSPALLISLGYVDLSKKSDFQRQMEDGRRALSADLLLENDSTVNM